MGFAVCYNGLCISQFRPKIQMFRTVVSLERGDPGALRHIALKRLDRELLKGNIKSALSIVKQLQGKTGGLLGFGAARQVPQRLYTLDELKLNGMDTLSLQSLVDSILDTIERSIQFCRHDVVSFKELESLMLNATSESLCEENHLMCMQHEAGHFLTAYLLGVLPREYSVPSMEALRKDQFMEGRVKFVGFEFLKEVNAGKMLKKKFNNGNLYAKVNKGKFSSKNLNRFSCIALGGLAAEYLVFGYSEGLHSDVDKLDTLLEWMGFTENEANSHLRWAVLNTILMLHRHHEARSKLAEAMALGRSVGFCIDAIENAINGEDI